MSSKDHISLDDVRAAKPSLRPTAEEWADSERGRQVLERVLAADREARPTVYRAESRRASWGPRPRLAFAGGFVVIVAVAVALAVVFTGNGGTKGVGPVASAPGATQTSTQASDGSGQLTTKTILSDLMPLYMEIVYQTADKTSSDTIGVDQAVNFGLISGARATEEALGQSMTNGEYAVLLVKAFRTLLWQSSPPMQAGDADDLPSAIQTLKKAGVILPKDGEFAPGDLLTKDTEQRLLSRVRDIFERVAQE